ncbi:hypothetical protein DH2020_023480 [Rehmannia glutinosa]|uniref:Sister chromatid cohesion 1 protein 3 n=1 Tax=Rehmannia glutinosa TaxID=99300 RepID=A0ABR0W671_REHGL
MFYSHTFLARKGPLGTVWCAAHLQHKLKKSHYISTNVPSTVEQIMCPEVPIALRISGHLLLGVVRIYSKQVDYFFEDCNEIRITINRVFTTVNVNLPNDATHAPFHSVTLPEKLDLDSLELDDYYKDCSINVNSVPWLFYATDQIPTGKDPYIVISFDEHDLRDSSIIEDNSGSGPTPMDGDVPPPVELDTAAGLKDPSPSNLSGANDRNVGSKSPQDLPSIEFMRDATHGFDFNNSPILPDRAAPDEFLEEQINKDKETFTPVTEEIMLPDGHFSSSHNHEEQHSLGRSNSPAIFVHQSPEMQIQPSPPPVAQPKVTRKRKQLFDRTIVLSNKHMENVRNDTSDIRRVKKNCPLSSLAIWKTNNRLRLRKEGFTCEPFITGTCAELHALYKEDSVPAKFQLATTEETHQETSTVQPPLNRQDSDTEIEILRNNECASPERYIPSFSTVVPSPAGRSYFTPENSNLGLQSEHMETTDGDGLLPTADMGTSGNLDSEMKTPDTFYGKDLQAEHTALSDIPELVASAGDLGFLEQDDYSPAGSQGTPEFGIFSKNQGTPELKALSSRTRAVAQYLKRQSSVTPILGNSEESSEDLSLNKILDGKPRKICARMFFETLVLKNYGLVDAHQENPYDDITLKVTPKLSKGQFSA